MSEMISNDMSLFPRFPGLFRERMMTMNQVWRKIDGVKYLMRDGRSTKELRKIYSDILKKYPGTTLTFHQWLVRFGKVYTY